MTKELQDLAWSVLPKEFKEEVKELYDSGIKMMDIRPSASEIYANKLSTLEGIFGEDNLTPDAEGEEMLAVSRKRVQEIFDEAQKVCPTCEHDRGFRNAELTILQNLFGSKCLPDEEQIAENANFSNLDSLSQNPPENCNSENHISTDDSKPAEPKFKIGDKVKDISSPHDGGIYKVDDIKKSSNGFIYHIQGLIGESNVKESDLEPYTEPKEDLIASNSGELKSQEADKHFDNILKDSFAKERRLNIAAMMMQGLLANPNNNANLSETVVDALNCADALIAEVEKGNSDGED